jgi:hypothetical protein
MEDISLKKFFDELGYRLKIYRDIKRKYNVYTASDFNVFDLFYVDENKISDLIAFLLNPLKEHSQGDVFLKDFFQKMGVQNELINFTPKIVEREYLTDKGGKIDIFIRLEKNGATYLLAVENKPWVEERKDQVSDYIEYLERYGKTGYKFLFLHRTGDLPKSIKKDKWKELENEGKVLNWSYDDLAEWLESCFKNCKAEKVRYIIFDFLNWIRKKFPLGGGNGSGN